MEKRRGRANARTIKLLVSSSYSAAFTNVDAVEDRPSRDRERDRPPLGDSDLARVLTRVLGRVEKAGLEVRSGRLVEDVSGDSSVAGDLVFET